MSVDYFDEGQQTSFKRVKKGSRTPILDNFSRDLNKLAEEGKIDPVIGRESEVKRIAQIISRKKKIIRLLLVMPVWVNLCWLKN